MALTENMKAFARAKMQGKSNKDAALAAGYSEKSAGSKGSQLARDPEVIAYLDGLLKQGGAGVDAFESMPLGEAAIKKELAELESVEDSLSFLKLIYKNPYMKMSDRLFAAKAALPFEHGKVGEMGIKEGRDQAAKETARKSKFATADEQRRIERVS